ncbi:hypothetical protein BH10BAC5_BH10BAC5_11880 [soil metagenome]
MRKLFLFTFVLLLCACTTFAQNQDASPFRTKTTTPNTPQAMWDLQFNYDVTTFTSLGNAGAEFDGNFIWMTKWSVGGAANKMFRVNKDGTVRDSFAVSGYTGASGIRDLAFDGRYIYGGSATGPNIVRIDTGTKAVVKTIVSTVGAGNVRAIAWDPGRNGFWVSGFAGNIFCVDTNGVTIATITNTLAGKYGLAYDNAPGGPFLYVFDQGAGASTPQTIYQISLVTMANTGVSFDVTTVVTGNAGIAGGLFVASNFVPGKVIIGGCMQGTPDRLFGLELRSVGTPLSAFTLQTPPAGTRIVTSPGSATPVTITWDTSATGANYKFIFGNPLPTRRFTIASATNSITTTLGALDAMLASNGFTNNGTASDSAVGNWDVWAFKAPGVVGGPDSLKSTNGPRAITFRRQQVALTPFALTAPAAGTSITTSPVNSSTVAFTWGASGSGATYKWLFKNAGVYTDPAFLKANSDGSGFTNSWTVRNSRLDSLLAAAGVAPGDSVVGVWRARAFSSTDSLNSTAPDRSLTLRRASLLPLQQDFSDPSMPPPFWTLDQGTAATQYWTRATVSGYGIGTGSAFYNFWSASATTGPQTLTSNQFPPVTAGVNYLRFNEACAYYSATAIDSCVIETSTDAGATWTRLIGMYQSLTLSSGYNSTPVMTTVAATAQFLAPTASQWATKIFIMPVGTNKVRFIAKSAFGNNLYIDDITSGPSTGIGDPISFTPNKYELSQNYPNPFNPATKISFALPKQGLVTLKVYDMLGKEVAQLVNEIRTAGNYQIDFNASNLSSGVYFYKLTAGEFTDVKRMMLVK